MCPYLALPTNFSHSKNENELFFYYGLKISTQVHQVKFESPFNEPKITQFVVNMM